MRRGGPRARRPAGLASDAAGPEDDPAAPEPDRLFGVGIEPQPLPGPGTPQSSASTMPAAPTGSAQVCKPTTPSTARAPISCAPRTAVAVIGPKMPSTTSTGLDAGAKLPRPSFSAVCSLPTTEPSDP